MYDLYPFLHGGAASRQPPRPQNVSLDGGARLAIAFAIVAAGVTLLDRAAATQDHTVVTASAVGQIHREN